MRTSGLNSMKHALLLGGSVAVFSLASAPAMAQNNNSQETVIVTGTRVQGMTAADSAAPITVLGNDALTKGTGTTDLRQALGQTVPSFTAQQFGFDTANLTLSAALRGLSPNDTLVLVNGKRRHYTGNLHVDSGDFAAGSSGADISLIPEAAIDHVEVLLDGAAAQYGTDAIAGVVNIILKKKSSGGTLTATAGNYYNNGGVSTTNGLKSGGRGYDFSYNMGLPLFDKGFINITVQKQYGNFTQLGGEDTKVAGLGPNGRGLQTSNINGDEPLSDVQLIPGYPRSNLIIANPEYQLTQGAINAGYDFSDNVSIYAFGTLSHRYGKAYENNRAPNKIIAGAGSNQPCSAANPGGYATALDVDGNPTCAIGIAGNWTAGDDPAGPGTQEIPGAAGLSGQAGQGLNAKGGVIFTAAGNGANGGYTTPGELIFSRTGFRPLEALKEDDYQYNAGVKFNVLGWDVDADIGYGKDINNIYTLNSGNVNLYADTHTTPTNFYDGTFTASQFTGTIDAVHQFNVGMASPLTVAIGVEAREDLYAISAGDPGSQYGAGGASFPGFLDTDAGRHSRKNYAGYLDLALAPIESLQLDIAGRAEHYTDFGDTQIGKFTARYDFSPQIGIRGTISTGFRAPTISEEFYTATNVSPVSSTIQLPADSPAAKALGLNNLKPETSTSYSAGIVAHPFEDLSVTVDAYSTTVGNRIVPSSTVYAFGGSPTSPLVLPAIHVTGRTIDPTVTQLGVSSFLNGVSTLTQGVDLTVNYPTDFGDYGLVDWTLAGNYNTTSISKVAAPPAIFGTTPLLTGTSLFNYAHSAPTSKIGLTANWSLDAFGLTLRETFYGPQHSLQQNSDGVVNPFNQASVGLTDLEARYDITEQLQFALGANNLFNIHPDTSPWILDEFGAGSPGPGDGGQVVDAPFNGSFSPNGGYYYARVTFNF